jgi:hypothetical protein
MLLVAVDMRDFSQGNIGFGFSKLHWGRFGSDYTVTPRLLLYTVSVSLARSPSSSHFLFSRAV